MGLFSQLFGYSKITLSKPFDQMKFYCLGGTSQLAREFIGAGVRSDWNEIEALLAHLVVVSYFYEKKYGEIMADNEDNLDEFSDFLSAAFIEFFRETVNHNLSKKELAQLLDVYGTRLEEYLPILDFDYGNLEGCRDMPILIPFYAFSSNLAKKLYKSPQDVARAVSIIGRYFDKFAFIMENDI